jgi:hypothetical protein
MGHATTDAVHETDALVARYERDRWLYGPVSLRSVDVCMTETGGLNLDENLALAWIWLRDVLDDEGTAELVNDGSFHGVCSLRDG